MKLRFSLRDLFWLVMLAALAVAWWRDHERWTFFYFEAAERAKNLAKERDKMEAVSNAKLNQARIREVKVEEKIEEEVKRRLERMGSK